MYKHQKNNTMRGGVDAVSYALCLVPMRASTTLTT